MFPLRCDQCNNGLYRLSKFLGQGLGSAQPISDDSLNGDLYPDQGFSYNFNRMGIS
jgi:hypothetical protein